METWDKSSYYKTFERICILVYTVSYIFNNLSYSSSLTYLSFNTLIIALHIYSLIPLFI